MKIGVLGANGFIGRALCLKYIDKGHDVLAFYNHNKNRIPNKCSIYSTDKLPNTQLDCLVISIGGHSLGRKQYLKQYLSIDSIIKNINFDKIIFISSVEVYGKNKETIRMNSCFNQPNIYGMSKISQEFLVSFVENSVILRPTYIYGPGMNNNSLIPIWINMAKTKHKITVFGKGERKQDYLYIDDFTDLCLHVAEKDKTGTFIAASGVSVSNLNLARKISDIIPGTAIKFSGEDTAGSSHFDISHTYEAYGWKPKVSIEQGLFNYLA